jgi:hypothetical protein
MKATAAVNESESAGRSPLSPLPLPLRAWAQWVPCSLLVPPAAYVCMCITRVSTASQSPVTLSSE